MLKSGQVDELYLSASRAEISRGAPRSEAAASGPEQGENLPGDLAEELVAQARQSAAGIRFIEDPTLLAEVGGVGASLRYRLDRTPSAPGGEEVA